MATEVFIDLILLSKLSYSGMDVVWTYIGFVRKKLRAVRADIEIRTFRGAGYTLEEENICKQQKATV